MTGHQGDEPSGAQSWQYNNIKRVIRVVLINYFVWTEHAWSMGNIKAPSGLLFYPCWSGCKVFGQHCSFSQHWHWEKPQTSTLTLTTTVHLELLIISLLDLLWLWKENGVPREESCRHRKNMWNRFSFNPALFAWYRIATNFSVLHAKQVENSSSFSWFLSLRASSDGWQWQVKTAV